METAIAAWLPEARWFAGKGGGPARISIHDLAPLPHTTLAATLVDVVSDSGRERYWMPVAADGSDAAITADFAAWVVRMVLTGTELPARAGSLRGRAAAAAELGRGFDADAKLAAVVPLGGDASNTSLRVTIGARDYAVKVLRRCRPGIQPEVEVGDFLAQIGWDGTPPFVGWLEYQPSGGDPTVLATVHEFVAGCTTAWEWLVELTPNGGVRGPNGPVVAHLVAALGRTTAEMHRALGSRSDVPAFAPDAPSADWAAAESGRMVDHAERVFDAARARRPLPSGSIAADMDRLLDRQGEIMATFRSLPQAGAAALERVHGDYHLGQVLVGAPEPRIYVIDFEGEPGRTLADRRRKTSVCKDVAGMCRSFDYLLRHISRTGNAPYSATDLAVLEQTFLDAYRAVANGHDWWPKDAAVADRLLAVYRLDKAVYELAYELANRPDWVEVPLAALLP